MRSVKRNKALLLLALVIVSFLTSVSSAFATDTPHLVWQRGRTQEVILGGNTQAQLWAIKLVGPDSSPLTFVRSSASNTQFLVYHVSIPKDFHLGSYVLETTGTNSTTVVGDVIIAPNTSYDPLYDPRAVGGLAVLAFSLLTAFTNRDSQNPNDPDPTNSPGTANSIDTNYHSIRIGRRGILDRLNLGEIRFVFHLDFLRHMGVYNLATRSPLLMRVFADGSYLQAMLGPLAFLAPIAGIILGANAGYHVHASQGVVPTSSLLFTTILVLGIADSLSGFLAFAAYGVSCTIQGDFTSILQVRSYIGLGVIWFGIILVAGAMRPLRRNREGRFLWERAGDLLIPALFLGWSVRGMVYGLQGFEHQQLSIVQNTNGIAFVAAGAIIARYVLEELSFQIAPARLEYLSPPTIPEQRFYVPFVSLFFKVLVYLIFVFSFLGSCWQTYVSVLIMILPGVLKVTLKHLPNSPRLYQILPSGIPGIIFTGACGLLIVRWVDTLPIFAPDKARTMMLLASVPGVVLNLLRLIGARPKSGDTKWYLRDNHKVFYTFFGPACVTIAALISYGAFS